METKENTNTLEEIFSGSAWAIGSVRCTYMPLFDQSGQKLFTINKKDAFDNPMVACYNQSRYENGEYVPVYLTEDAVQLISEKVKDNKRTAYFEKVLNDRNGVWVKKTDVFWTEMPAEVQESITTEQKKRVSKLALVGGIILMLIGK